MPRRIRIDSRLLRSVMLALLMLGVIVKPMLGSWCDLHVLGDQLSGYVAAGDAAHDPAHLNDREHARGAHDSLHEDNTSSAYADIGGILELPDAPFASVAWSAAPIIPLPISESSSRFRPPIA